MSSPQFAGVADSFSALPPPVPLKQDATIIGLVGLAHASSHFSHLLLPLMFPVFMTEFGLSFGQLGFLMTVFFVISGIGQASAGFVVDRFGARPVLFASFGFFMLACWVAASATGYGWLMAVAVLAGLGNSTFHPVDFTILNQRVSSPRLGHAFSAHGLTGNLGWAAAPVFMASITALSHWRTAYVCAGLLFAVVLAVLVFQRDKLQSVVVTRSAVPEPGGSFAFIKIPMVWGCFAFLLLSTMALAVMQNFSIPILKAVHGVSFEMATLTLTAYLLFSALGILVGGFVAARYPLRSDQVVATCLAVGAAMMAACASGWLGSVGTMVLLATTGFAIGIGGPSRDLMIKKVTPKGATGRVYGMVYSGFDAGFAIAPLLFGLLMDRGWYSLTLLGVAGVLLIGVCAALGVGRATRA